MPMSENEERTERVYRIVLHFCQLTREGEQFGTNDDLNFEIVGDLLCDLHHLADEYGLDWGDLQARADMHHSAEVWEGENDAA